MPMFTRSNAMSPHIQRAMRRLLNTLGFSAKYAFPSDAMPRWQQPGA